MTDHHHNPKTLLSSIRIFDFENIANDRIFIIRCKESCLDCKKMNVFTLLKECMMNDGKVPKNT